MNRFYKYIFIIVAASSLALTPAERKIVQHAQANLQEAQNQLKTANEQRDLADQRAQAAEQKAGEADKHAAETDVKAATLGTEIETAHKNEQRLSNENAKMKPVYDKVRKWWGIGGIIFGFGLLAKHLLILTGVLIVLGLVAWLLSITIAPWLAPFIKMIGNFFGAIFTRISNIFKKKQ